MTDAAVSFACLRSNARACSAIFIFARCSGVFGTPFMLIDIRAFASSDITYPFLPLFAAAILALCSAVSTLPVFACRIASRVCGCIALPFLDSLILAHVSADLVCPFITEDIWALFSGRFILADCTADILASVAGECVRPVPARAIFALVSIDGIRGGLFCRTAFCAMLIFNFDSAEWRLFPFTTIPRLYPVSRHNAPNLLMWCSSLESN